MKKGVSLKQNMTKSICQNPNQEISKVHKPAIDKCPRFFPILSAITTPSYNLAKFLIPILSPLIEDEFAVQGSFSNEIIDLNYNYLMTSLDVESLF